MCRASVGLVSLCPRSCKQRRSTLCGYRIVAKLEETTRREFRFTFGFVSTPGSTYATHGRLNAQQRFISSWPRTAYVPIDGRWSTRLPCNRRWTDAVTSPTPRAVPAGCVSAAGQPRVCRWRDRPDNRICAETAPFSGPHSAPNVSREIRSPFTNGKHEKRPKAVASDTSFTDATVDRWSVYWTGGQMYCC